MNKQQLEPEEEVQDSHFWGKVPTDWQLVPGTEVYQVNPNPEPDEEPNTYIEMDSLDTELPFPRYYGKRNASEHSGKTFKAEDTLFARITPCTENGKSALVPDMDTDVGIGSTEFAVLSPNINRINPFYLFYIAKSHPVHNYAISRMRGSTGRQRVPFSVFRNELDIALPPLPEQRKIASVLYTVDQAIQKTEAIIKQTERVKQGVMQELFSNIEDEPHFPLQEAISDICYGTDTKSKKDGEGLPTLRIPNIVGKKLTLDDLKYTSLSGSEKEKLKLKEGDLLLIRTNGNPEYVGQTVIFPEMDGDYVFASYLIRIRVDQDKVRPRFLSKYLNSRKGRGEMSGWIRTSAGNHNLGISAIEKFSIPDISLKEQELVVERIDVIENRIEKNEDLLNRLKRLKRGLMKDLLTGEVRTKNRDIAVVDAVREVEG